MERFILDDINLNEISAVDDPAQPTAKATIFKRAKEVQKEAGPSGDNTNPEEEFMKPEEIEKMVSEAVEATKAELTKSFADDLAKAVNEAFDTMLAFDGEELDLFKAKDKAAQDELMSMSPEERKKKLKGEKAADEVVKFEGKEISKSAVGDATFALYKRLEAMDIEVAKAKDAEEFAKLEKRASEEFGNLPGTDVEKAKILKAVGALDEEVKKSLEAILKSANEGNKEAFVQKGAKGAVDANDAVAKKAALDGKVSEIMTSRSVTKTKAFEIVAIENPELI